MCGIVGLFLKNASLESNLGALVAPMLVSLSDRGPDSTGFAVYGTGIPDQTTLSLRGSAETNFDEVAAQLGRSIDEGLTVTHRDTHAVIAVPSAKADFVPSRLEAIAPEIAVVGIGERMELYKEVGSPTEVTTRFALCEMSGTHAIGHTRMATESAVTTDGPQPTWSSAVPPPLRRCTPYERARATRGGRHPRASPCPARRSAGSGGHRRDWRRRRRSRHPWDLRRRKDSVGRPADRPAVPRRSVEPP
jgi:glutamate synthase domain-containing protein 1